ncbi:unnamed protein product [Owenia fusiformis]|uniref:Uncharacterized protein n=1 Tax=Owenia fusiformis TaxID=6347 RepID=A0A8J1XH14_OWEFU|nr:unnamed protein product [Owenia fusiformis]
MMVSFHTLWNNGVFAKFLFSFAVIYVVFFQLYKFHQGNLLDSEGYEITERLSEINDNITTRLEENVNSNNTPTIKLTTRTTTESFTTTTKFVEDENLSFLTQDNIRDYIKYTEKDPAKYKELKKRCAKRKFSSKILPFTALASVQGSGNTFTRFLVECITGIHSGTTHFDGKLHAAGFMGEGVINGSTVVIKSHQIGFSPSEKFDRGIMVIRNPYRMILAEWNRRHSGGHISHARPERFKTEEDTWRAHVIAFTEKWLLFALQWIISFEKELLILVYENMVNDTVRTLRQLHEFLTVKEGIKEGSLKRLPCAFIDNTSGFQRPAVNYGIDPFTPRERRRINEYMEAVCDVYKTRTHDTECAFKYNVETI